MSTREDPFERFEETYAKMLEFLTSKQGDDEILAPLTFVEDAVEGAGAEDYLPEWLSPYASIAGQLIIAEASAVFDTNDEQLLQDFMTALIPAVSHAVRLGYTEGYFEGKAD